MDTGGLSGATPKEAVTWGKIDPKEVEKSVIVYTDSTIALPLITSYIMQNTSPKKLKRLYDRKDELMEKLKNSYFENFRETAPKEMSRIEELLSNNF